VSYVHHLQAPSYNMVGGNINVALDRGCWGCTSTRRRRGFQGITDVLGTVHHRLDTCSSHRSLLLSQICTI
jgi:hypothetical protein